MTPKSSISTKMNIAQLKRIKQNFVQELQAANAGKKTSLPFIVHKLSSAPIVRDGEVFEALIIGGTILKRALCKKVKDQISILEKERELPLEFKTENDFLKFIERELAKDVNVLALNFAYPLKPVFENGRLDGVLLAVTKEGGFHGLVGKKVGEEIERYIFKKRNKKIRVCVANDTICLLMSGITKYKWDDLAAGIVGTGFNIAFFLGRQKAVNLESANFDKFPQTKEGRIVDQNSAKPGRSLFEKETAGAYLYRHFNLIIKERGISHPQISSTEELNTLCHPEFISGSSFFRDAETASDGTSNVPVAFDCDAVKQVQHDRGKVSQIAKDLIKRSAQLVACQIAGITEFMGRNMVFNMEGSLFWKGNGYRETVEKTVKQLVPKYNVRFVEIENSAILGAAKLVA